MKLITFGLQQVDPKAHGFAGYCAGAGMDASNMYAKLKDEARTALYRDASATATSILNDPVKFAADLQQNELLVMHISGHGAQMPEDGKGDIEADKMDECIVAYDRLVRDDEIAEMISRLPKHGRLLLIVDTCHSETMARSWFGAVFAMIRKPFKIVSRHMERTEIPTFVISGCSDDKYSYGDDEKGGYLTSAFCKVYRPDMTIPELFAAISKAVPKEVQIPQYSDFNVTRAIRNMPMSSHGDRKLEDHADKWYFKWYKWWKELRESFEDDGTDDAPPQPPETDNDDSTTDSPVPPPPMKQGHTLAGYGRVNAWATNKDTLIDDIMACARHGVKIYHIEFMAWAPYAIHGNTERKKLAEECYKAAIEECRLLGMWLFVSFSNSNTGSGKYGDAGIPLSKMGATIEWGIEVIKKHGKENVLLQPMAETSSENAGIEDRIRKAFEGWELINNRGSRPGSKPSWAKFNAYHPFSINDKVPSDQIIVSDTGSAIREKSSKELCNGLEGSGKPQVAGAWAKKLKAKGVPAVVFYHFKYAEHDEATIKAMGEAVRTSRRGTTNETAKARQD